jgi:short-subunit dehydrogenase
VLGESLWDEPRADGVDVLVLAPGLTETPGMAGTGPDRASLAGRMTMAVAPVVRGARVELGRRPLSIPGLSNRLSTALLTRLLPRRLSLALLGRSMRGLYPRLR